ncbi:MAG: Methyltransferase [Acidobacteria bacterium]|nr:Methyltransferase [Acidobacteriota bacterium]
MDQLLSQLDETKLVLDLGCGGGSFDYFRYRCRIVGVDFSFPGDAAFQSRCALPHAGFMRGLSHQLPLRDGCVDMVVCNNTMEHFGRLAETLAEIQRVTHDSSRLYISVPNGYGFDDRLYRFLLLGGGHVNRFSFSSLRELVEATTRFRLRSFRRLFASFIYLNRPRKEVLIHLPKRMRVYYYLGPQWLLRPGMLVLNLLVRWVDLLFGTESSQYGWAFYFESQAGPVIEKMPNVNVCVNCGAGHTSALLRSQKKILMVWPRLYRCPSCQALNVLFQDPHPPSR